MFILLYDNRCGLVGIHKRQIVDDNLLILSLEMSVKILFFRENVCKYICIKNANMDVLTDTSLRRLADSISNTEDILFHNTTLAYIRVLLTPYVEIINNAGDKKEWLLTNFPDSMEYYINSGTPTSDAIKAIISEIMNRTLSIYDGYDNEYTPEYNINTVMDSSVLPWDVQYIITHTPILAERFNVNINDNTLPVDIRLGRNLAYTNVSHMLTFEFVAGLLLFLSIGDFHAKIEMFGKKLTSNYMLKHENTDEFLEESTPRWLDNKESYKYMVTVNGVDGINFGFNTTDFMRGFITGAMWFNVPHHDYCYKLVEHSNDVDIPLTF